MFKTIAELQRFIARQAFGQTTADEDQAFEQHLFAVAGYGPDRVPFQRVNGQLVYTFAADHVSLGSSLGPVTLSFDSLLEGEPVQDWTSPGRVDRLPNRLGRTAAPYRWVI
ncbi:hypothetical protein A6O24_20875 [Acidithiobacillus thiooxidans]|uniref:Uncharacterized protein n=1 Tax=Acidithiobacillus thiooxidans TaxID=930 RepID=A0A1C2HUL1_ACITH|nr:hypothetical protein [Acidithiobacillus thiooxidans]OCX67448.1 hypothetical protein A6O24_20875 [Acidithiobacillus thiooxidans]OCX67974.1 hypothetical protein A6P07_19065 [Acidithiobacillus thiooxidans]OCX85811.1 hypothetical protein A6O26_00270 [Acidithiobacillus thiooxidans]OFC48544.1 hypothetical protein BAE47_07580 [Acidithiobacillus thiooxidans]